MYPAFLLAERNDLGNISRLGSAAQGNVTTSFFQALPDRDSLFCREIGVDLRPHFAIADAWRVGVRHDAV